MSARPLTDAQISQALRAHLPEAAATGLRERVFHAAETTAQSRSLPSFLAALSDADPIGRRRNVLIAAALLAALAIACATAVGAWRLLQRDPIDELGLEPPNDVAAFVLSSYERLPQLPPVTLTWRDSGSTKGRIYVDGSGAVRFDRFASADATEPSGYRILSPDHRISGVATVDSEEVWVEPGHEAIGEDPRVHIRTVLSVHDVPPGCEMERDPGEVGDGTAASGWRYVGLEYVAGRPTHHVTCAGDDLWLDIETRLILRTREPLIDDAGQAIPGQFETTEVTQIAFGDQPAAVFETPEGLARISEDAYRAYICARDLPNEMAPGISDCPTAEAEPTPLAVPSPTPAPTPDVRPGSGDCAVPASDPSEPNGPLAWTPERKKEDWPAPVRPEPAGGGGVQPMPLTFLDPMGDNGSTAYPCVDIRGVMADTADVHLKLDSGQPVADPAAQWIAYGVVTDDDRDGVPDWRYGIDNDPSFRTESMGHVTSRWWRTNLHTGETVSGGMDGFGDLGWLTADFKAVYPSGFEGSRYWRATASDVKFTFGGANDTTQGSKPWGFVLDMPFYTWASVIVDGRVVATDYAPDTGWLVAAPGAKPGGTFLLGDPFPHLSMTVPAGWTGDEHGVSGNDFATVRFDVIDDPEDLCSDTIDPPLGSSFDDLVSYVARLPTIEVSGSADVVVDGFRGKHIRYSSVESDADCDFAGASAGAYDNVWILDVDGVHLLIVSGWGGSTAEGAVTAEIRQMVESIRFER